jgi:ligand-binding sensor domain-containing protein
MESRPTGVPTSPPSLAGKGGWGVRSIGWLLLSAIALGAAVAGKYPYAVVGLAILPFLPWRQRAGRTIVAFALLALVTFFILDPTLWPNPVGRLERSLFFHPLYSQSAQVTRFNLPWWKPLEYLSRPVPWHPGVFYVGWDGWIFLLGLLGLPFLWRHSRPYAAWLLLGLGLLLVWPTKWPQYTLIVIPPLCLSLAYALTDMVKWANERFELSDYLEPFALPQYTWVLAGAFALVVAVILFLGAFLRWQNNLGWLQVNSHNSGLISDCVQVLAADKNDRLWIGTNAGLAVLDGQTWAAYTVESGALPSNDVRALAITADGTLWVGTGRGVSTFDGSRWRSFLAGDPGGGPASDEIRGLAMSPDGHVWAGTTGGLSTFDGRTWSTYRSGNSGLPSDLVFTVAIDHAGRVWAGTDRGVGVFDPQTQTWQRYDPANSGLQWPAVSTIAVDPNGRLWLGTLGGGLAVFDGQGWQSFTTSNSDLPWNTIWSVTASPQGEIWLAADLPSAAGGNVARWDGRTWKTFTTQRSGIASGSSSCFAFDREGRVWIGMRTTGLSVYTTQP